MLRDLKQAGERSRLDPFVAATGDARPGDQRHLMQRPFLSQSRAANPLRGRRINGQRETLPTAGLRELHCRLLLITGGTAARSGPPYTNRTGRNAPY